MPSTKCKKLAEAFHFLSDINRIAYSDVRLMANQVLSKNPFASDFINNYVEGLPVQPISHFIILLNLARYYFRSCICIVLFIVNKTIFHLFGTPFGLGKSQNSIVLIDIFFLLDRIESDYEFHDQYFPGLEEILVKRKTYFAYVPTFHPTPSPFRLAKLLKKLRDEQVPVLTEFELISSNALITLCWLIISYPFKVIGFALSLPCDTYEYHLLKNELLKSVGSVSFLALSRYLQGIRLSSLSCVDLRVISWYENQVIHKTFYKGLRSGHGQVKIYGAQLFLYPTSILNILVDPAEVSHDILPDKVIVNGSYYVRPDIDVPMVPGPSLRYKKIFGSTPSLQRRENLLVLLPYHPYEIINILDMVSHIDWPQNRILIKFHPTVNPQKYLRLIPPGVKFVGNDIYDLFPKARMIISAESGALIEGACLGIPGIVIQNQTHFTHNPFPKEGKGIIWDLAHDISELNNLIHQFNQRIEGNSEEIMKLANYYKSIFFTEVSEEGIIKAFDLN